MTVTPEALQTAIALLTLGGTVIAASWGLTNRLEKRMDARFDRVDSRIDTMEDELADVRHELVEVKIGLARLEGPQPRVFTARS